MTEREAPLMLDTTPITTEITRLIATGTTEQALPCVGYSGEA